MKYKIKKKEPVVPLYGIFPLLACVTVNAIIYYGAEKLVGSWKHYDLTLPVDRLVPVMPGFVLVYLGCYLFWIVNYILIARQGEEHCLRFATADMISRIVCCVFFILLPTTNVRPELTGDGIFISLLQMVYSIDAPTRLFPSIHCLVSWLSYIGIRGQKGVGKPYRIFSCVFALLVCVSTQVTKQHYIVDVFGSIIVAEAAFWLAFHTNLYKYPKRVFDWLYRSCFIEKRVLTRKRERCDD